MLCSQVNIARIHNYNVQLKKEAREKEGGEQGKRGVMKAAGTIPASAMPNMMQ